jgi:flagellar hook assembly protein FlgD
MEGRLVRVLADGLARGGEHAVVWDGRDRSGRQVASGVYQFRLTAPGVLETRRIVRTR